MLPKYIMKRFDLIVYLCFMIATIRGHKASSNPKIFFMPLIKFWLDISNLLSTKKNPGAKAPGFFPY